VSIFCVQARRKEKMGRFPRAPRHLGVPPSLKNLKYTGMRRFKNNKIPTFSPQMGPARMFSPGSAVALDVPACVAFVAWMQFKLYALHGQCASQLCFSNKVEYRGHTQDFTLNAHNSLSLSYAVLRQSDKY